MAKERVKKSDRVAQGCNCAYSNSKHAKYCWFVEKCKHKFIPHECDCDLCDAWHLEICDLCGELKKEEDGNLFN